MKNRFVKLTLMLCVIMMMAAPASSFAASSCGNSKAANRSCTNYMSLFTKSNNDCMNALLKAFGLKIKTPAADTNTDAGADTSDSANSENGSSNSTNGSSNCGNIDSNNQNCTGKWNCGTNSSNNCTGGNCDNDNNDCIGGNCGNTGNGNGAGTNGSQNENKPSNGGSASVSSYAQQVADLVNDERSSAGLSSLTMNAELCKVAQAKAEDMRDNNYFSHTSPTYGSPFEMMKQFGISYSAAGENIAKGQRSPESVMTAWMNSQGHRANILNSSYEQIGVGYCTDANGNTYWVQMFIK